MSPHLPGFCRRSVFPSSSLIKRTVTAVVAQPLSAEQWQEQRPEGGAPLATPFPQNPRFDFILFFPLGIQNQKPETNSKVQLSDHTFFIPIFIVAEKRR
jgi:hypothetical protein